MTEAKQLLAGLPDDYAALALERFDEIFFLNNRDKEEPFETAGDVLRAAFNWAGSEEGYEFWAGVHAEYGYAGIYLN